MGCGLIEFTRVPTSSISSPRLINDASFPTSGVEQTLPANPTGALRSRTSRSALLLVPTGPGDESEEYKAGREFAALTSAGPMMAIADPDRAICTAAQAAVYFEHLSAAVNQIQLEAFQRVDPFINN